MVLGVRAILPLVLFLFLVLKFILKHELENQRDEDEARPGQRELPHPLTHEPPVYGLSSVRCDPGDVHSPG